MPKASAWRRRCAQDGSPPYTALAGDVLDLLSFPQPLWQKATAMPHGGLLLIIAGPPCQDLTVGPQRSGLRGICGHRSQLAVLVPAVALVLQQLRPDLRVHVLLESSGSVHRIHRQAITSMLGVPANHAVSLDAQAWTAFSR